MKIRVHPPFGEGKTWIDIEMRQSVGVADFLRLLFRSELGLPIDPCNLENSFDHFILIRRSEILTRESFIHPDDELHLMMPLTGG